MTAHDFVISDHGSVVLLVPLTAGARAWVDENLPADAATFAGGIAIEARYVGDIVDGAIEAGFAVEWQP